MSKTELKHCLCCQHYVLGQCTWYMQAACAAMLGCKKYQLEREGKRVSNKQNYKGWKR